MDIDWGVEGARIDHVARHDIAPTEVEEMLFARHRQVRGGEMRRSCVTDVPMQAVTSSSLSPRALKERLSS